MRSETDIDDIVSGCFFFNDPATTEIYTLSLHDALPISENLLGARRYRYADGDNRNGNRQVGLPRPVVDKNRSEEHTSELQSH